MNDAELWIGLVEAIPGEPRPDDVDESVAGAFAHFVCMAPHERAFRAAAARYFRSEGWRLVRVEDVEPVSQRLASGHSSAEVMQLIDRVRRTGQPDTADEWDVWPFDGDE